ncbi:MAG: hypothetical protein II337_02595, partial [Clostridia bacterium]|nr:hypothetical protein [Clostridia bacterium]
YRETYFTSDLDVTYLCREGADIAYSYYPHGLDDVWNSFASNLLTSATVQGMVDKFAGSVDSLIETHVLPNQVALDSFRQQGYFD